MDVRYRTRRLQRCAASRAEAIKRWGPKVAERYHQRLALIRSVDSLQELGPSRALHLHPLKGARAGTWALNLTEQWRLIVRPVDHGVIVEEVSRHYE
jgi:proteic killer suppression protein